MPTRNVTSFPVFSSSVTDFAPRGARFFPEASKIAVKPPEYVTLFPARVGLKPALRFAA